MRSDISLKLILHLLYSVVIFCLQWFIFLFQFWIVDISVNLHWFSIFLCIFCLIYSKLYCECEVVVERLVLVL